MKNRLLTKLVSAVLTAGLALSLIVISSPENVQSKASVKIAKKATVDVGATKKIKIKTSGIKKVVKISAKSSEKSVVKAKKAGKKAVAVTGRKEGTATVTVTVKYKIKAKSKTRSKKLTC